LESFEIDQMRRQRSSYLKAIVGLEALRQLRPDQAATLARYKDQVARIEGLLTEKGVPLDG